MNKIEKILFKNVTQKVLLIYRDTVYKGVGHNLSLHLLSMQNDAKLPSYR